jgi:methionyl-tRNA synthetase
MSNSRYTVTAALPYANGPLHIGHLAGAYLPADIFVRFLRLKGENVLFVCGSDEHGAAITLRAQKEGKTPQEIVDQYHFINEKAFADMGIDFDIYHRTSAPLHHETAQQFFLKLSEENSFEIKESEQLFDEEFQQFLADRYIIGTCPKCGNDSAYGDQCERCGATLSPTDLINPRSALSGNTPVWKKTRHWYLPLERHQEWLTEWISTGDFSGRKNPVSPIEPENWKSNVKGQCLSWLKDGLRARAMTRDLDWGVPVPLKDAEGKVLYVWLDAPIGYISATREWAAKNNTNWETWWKDKDSKLVHFIGKDNIVFHCIIFPALLKLHGGFVLPHNVPANEFLNLEGQKISTSRNHAVWLPEYLEDFPGKRDELRYVLTSIAPETGDSEFTWKDFQTRVNSELVAIPGNLANRVLVLYHKFFNGVCSDNLVLDDPDLVKAVEDMYRITEENIMQYNFRSAQFQVIELAREGNKYLTRCEPWKSFKENPEQARKALDNCLVLLAHLAMGMRPFMPDTAAKLSRLLNINPENQKWGEPVQWPENHTLPEPELLFTKIEDEAIEYQRNKLATGTR